ncbi:hypothetical protein DFH07DRAFT_564868 [Mycena maculata]|uniref:Uncharacterized protein n=1 Tax=Mycena maculata TaxID=230809 RepID=A0AAD7N6B1_9AGAR|nr:hypothetical protein DFH07DRAFT_564868 [Mycena maculata]
MSQGTPSSSSGATSSEVGASYPSPISTTGSPNLEQTSTQSVAESPAQARGDPQHSLRQASAALQAAYRRIRQVRRSLVELTEPLPSSSDAEDIGPGHSALLLTASPIDESSDLDEPIDFQTMRSNLAAMDRQTQEYLDRFATSSWSDNQQPPELPRPRRQVQLPSPSTSAEPLHHPALPRRSLLETQLARRRELGNNPDDAVTFLGRRVAAREAAGASRAAESQPPSHVDPIHRAVEMERELIHLRALQHQRRTDPGMNARADALARADMIRAARSLDMETLRAQRQQPTNISTNVPMHSRAPPNPRRWRAYRAAAESRQSSNSTQSPASAHPHPHPDSRDSRLSILSNFSVQNLATPTSAVARDRPLLFEEPLSYTGQRRDSREIVDSPIGSERSYFIHRRVNADGDELVHNINLEWDDEDPLSWLMPTGERPGSESQDYPAFPRRRFAPLIFDGHETVRGARGPPPVLEPRRRGWARLDPDGNAIPSDEEDELERSRAEYRLQALVQARAAGAPARAERRSVDGSGNDRNAGAFANLITRTSVSPDDYPARETASPRVRLNSRDARNTGGQRLGFGSVMDSVMSVDNRPRQTRDTAAPYGSSVPYVVDPLPIPLSQMMPPKTDQKVRLSGLRVSRQAALAGR